MNQKQKSKLIDLFANYFLGKKLTLNDLRKKGVVFLQKDGTEDKRLTDFQNAILKMLKHNYVLIKLWKASSLRWFLATDKGQIPIYISPVTAKILIKKKKVQRDRANALWLGDVYRIA